MYHWFFIVDFGLGRLAQANAWVKIKIVTAALLRARFNVGDVVQIRRVMEKNTTPVYMGLFCLFWCHANGKISIGSGQSMEEGSERHNLCHPLQSNQKHFHRRIITLRFSTFYSSQISEREEVGSDLSKCSVGSPSH